jgi:hypothetical protein
LIYLAFFLLKNTERHVSIEELQKNTKNSFNIPHLFIFGCARIVLIMCHIYDLISKSFFFGRPADILFACPKWGACHDTTNPFPIKVEEDMHMTVNVKMIFHNFPTYQHNSPWKS